MINHIEYSTQSKRLLDQRVFPKTQEQTPCRTTTESSFSAHSTHSHVPNVRRRRLFPSLRCLCISMYIFPCKVSTIPTYSPTIRIKYVLVPRRLRTKANAHGRGLVSSLRRMQASWRTGEQPPPLQRRGRCPFPVELLRAHRRRLQQSHRWCSDAHGRRAHATVRASPNTGCGRRRAPVL